MANVQVGEWVYTKAEIENCIKEADVNKIVNDSYRLMFKRFLAAQNQDAPNIQNAQSALERYEGASSMLKYLECYRKGIFNYKDPHKQIFTTHKRIENQMEPELKEILEQSQLNLVATGVVQSFNETLLKAIGK